MTEKTTPIYECANCGAQSIKWSGRCLECGQWGTLTPGTAEVSDRKKRAKTVAAELISLDSIDFKESYRLPTGISEADQVLGGGMVPGSLVLLGGEPGIGKSTLVAQIAVAIGRAAPEKTVAYFSGEESAGQVKSRFDRLAGSASNIRFAGETNVDKIIAAIESSQPALAIIDSIQTVNSPLVASEPGGISQIRAASAQFLELAKKSGIPIIMIGHITKDGSLAGPKSLEHLVDVVLYLEADDARNFRILRSAKNRFGSVNEIGIFDMTMSGFKEIKNPSAVFLEASHGQTPGSVTSCVMEGSRPFLVEVQALVTKTVFGYPQRKSAGFDLNRLQILIAVLTKRAKINLNNQDVILNVVGGQKLNDTGLDLAVCLAIVSSLSGQIINHQTIAMGEVGLGGEIRNISRLERRVGEAEKLGFNLAIMPNADIKANKIKLAKIKSLEEIKGLIN